MEFDEKGKVVVKKRRMVVKNPKDEIPAICVVTRPRPKKRRKFSSDGKFSWEVDIEEEEEVDAKVAEEDS
jgi:hypothetical protein